MGLHVKYPLLLSDFDDTLIFIAGSIPDSVTDIDIVLPSALFSSVQLSL